MNAHAVIEPQDRVLVITRRFEAPRLAVFAAWTDERKIAEWWGPRGFAIVSCRADVRIGGSWRVDPRSPEGGEHHAGGAYREATLPSGWSSPWPGMARRMASRAARPWSTSISPRTGPERA